MNKLVPGKREAEMEELHDARCATRMENVRGQSLGHGGDSDGIH